MVLKYDDALALVAKKNAKAQTKEIIRDFFMLIFIAANYTTLTR
jgi:hypothetical protein